MIRRFGGAALFGLAVIVTFLASAPWLRGYTEGTLVVHLAVASTSSALIPLAVARVFKRSFLWSVGASSLTLLLYLMVVVLRQPFGFSTLVRGLSNGLARLLSSTLPLGDNPSFKVFPIVACWVVGALIGEMVLRSRSVGLPVLVAFGSFACSFAVTAGGLSDGVGWSIALLLATGVLVFLRRWVLDQGRPGEMFEGDESGRSVGGLRPLFFGSAALMVTAVVCGVVVPGLSVMKAEPVVLNRKPPQLESVAVSPLADVSTMRRNAANGDDPVVLKITLDQPGPAFLPMASLDSFDGNTWRTDQVYVPTGGRIRFPARPKVGAGHVTQDVEVVGDLPGGGVWLPAMSQVTEVTGLEVRYSEVNGMVIPADPLEPSMTYQVSSALAPGTFRSLFTTPDALKLDGRDYGFTPIPGEVQTEATKWADGLASPQTGSSSTSVQQIDKKSAQYLVKLLDALSRDFSRTEESKAKVDSFNASSTTSSTAADTTGSGESVAVSAPPTTESGRISSSATGFNEISSSLVKSKAATPEQYATLVALMLRSQGISARVATGFRLGADSAKAGVVAAGEHEVHASQAWTWVEVPTKEQGWVAVDPTPQRTNVEAPDHETTAPVGGGGSVSTAAPATAGSLYIPPHALCGRADDPGCSVPLDAHGNEDRDGLPLAAVGAPMLGLALLSVLPLYRVQRRARRRRGPPTQQAIGAWHELLDTLDRSGAGDVEALTNEQVADLTTERFGEAAGPPAAHVAAIANQALFYPQGVGPEQASTAWSELGLVRRAISKSQKPLRRVLAFLRPGNGVRG